MKMSDNEMMTVMEMVRNHLLHEKGQWSQCSIILFRITFIFEIMYNCTVFYSIGFNSHNSSFYLNFEYEKIRSWVFLRHEIKIIELMGHELGVRTLWTCASLLLKMKTHYRNKMGGRIAQNDLWQEAGESISLTPCLCHHNFYSIS